MPFSISVDQVGVFCTDIDLLQPVSAVLLDHWDSSSHIFQPPDTVLGIPEGPYLDQASSNGLAQFDFTIDKLRAAGINIKHCRTFADIQQIDRVHRRLISAEMARVHQAWWPQHSASYRPLTRNIIESGLEIDDAELHSLQRDWKDNMVSVAAEMDDLGIDFWLAPAATDHADRGLGATGNPVMNLPWTHAGMPVVSLPTHLDDQDLPHGLQVIGKCNGDEQLLPLCNALSAILSYPVGV